MPREDDVHVWNWLSLAPCGEIFQFRCSAYTRLANIILRHKCNLPRARLYGLKRIE